MTETWKPVVGYDGAYEVSPLGVVRSRRQVLKPQPAPNGVGETPGSSRLDSRARCEWSELEGGHSGCGAGSMIDPAEKRACDMGWCEGRPEPTPDGPYFPFAAYQGEV